MRKAFRVKTKDREILSKLKNNLKDRLSRKHQQKAQATTPVLSGGNVRYEMSGRVRGLVSGGIAAIHEMVRASGFVELVNSCVRLFKIRQPYSESDHILALAYNIFHGGTCVEDLEECRCDENLLDALGAQSIPDPTTAGDFLRRFTPETIVDLMEVKNEVSREFWLTGLSDSQRRMAYIEGDGTIAPTDAQTKQGMDISYKGLWGYHPLVISLANTKEPLYIVNRPGNAPSSQGAAEYFDRALKHVLAVFDKATLRGDTDFSQTRYLDAWDKTGRVRFVFGYDCIEAVRQRAQQLVSWSRLSRPKRYEVKTRPRRRPANIKQQIVKQRGYKEMRLLYEDVAEFDYQPGACKKPYRMVVVRKTIRVEQGQLHLFDEQRYFFYITNDWQAKASQIVFEANKRCDQENLLSQLHSQVHALRPRSNTLESNWAWMVIASLAWTFKSWFSLMIPEGRERHKSLCMEFKGFVRRFIRIPCQLVCTGGESVLRILGYNDSLPTFFAAFDEIRRLRILRV